MNRNCELSLRTIAYCCQTLVSDFPLDWPEIFAAQLAGNNLRDFLFFGVLLVGSTTELTNN